MADVGDVVQYGAYGECEICDRRKEPLAGALREYFVLKQRAENAVTIYVPVEKAEAFRPVRAALTAEEIQSLVKAAGGYVNWKDDDKTREAKYRRAFERADLTEIAGILKDIAARQEELKASKRKLRAADLNAAKICGRILYGELSRSLSLRAEDVYPLITGKAAPAEK